MAIMRQTTATIDPGGTRQLTTYLPDSQGKLTLAQQQLIEKKETPAGYTETTIVRFASPNDSGKLGPPRKAEEIVCTGSCGRPPQP